MRITSPDSYAKMLGHINNFEYWEASPTKANQGTATPTSWYFTQPTINANGAAQFNISFDQMPDQSYTVTYSYKRITPTLATSTDVPFFSPSHHHILIDYALWKYAEREADPSLNPEYFRVSWENGLTSLLEKGFVPSREMTPIPGPQ